MSDEIVFDIVCPEDECDNCQEIVGIDPVAGHTDDGVLLCAGCWYVLFPKAAKARKRAHDAALADGYRDAVIPKISEIKQ